MCNGDPCAHPHAAAAAAADRAAASDTRRLKRKAVRRANTTCFACREVGHSAKDCPSIQPDTNGIGEGAQKAKNLIGICYRYASDRDRESYIRH